MAKPATKPASPAPGAKPVVRTNHIRKALAFAGVLVAIICTLVVVKGATGKKKTLSFDHSTVVAAPHTDEQPKQWATGYAARLNSYRREDARADATAGPTSAPTTAQPAGASASVPDKQKAEEDQFIREALRAHMAVRSFAPGSASFAGSAPTAASAPAAPATFGAPTLTDKPTTGLSDAVAGRLDALRSRLEAIRRQNAAPNPAGEQ